ncbi:hypothetical protein [Salinicoccus albus]|uniref:hypothetical protein n=1 Tax=Salinicoccus albus TaxID=418756 RepID=UPI0003640CFE|nr:hypothetical protein [Salinicoccus albus]
MKKTLLSVLSGTLIISSLSSSVYAASARENYDLIKSEREAVVQEEKNLDLNQKVFYPVGFDQEEFSMDVLKDLGYSEEEITLNQSIVEDENTFQTRGKIGFTVKQAVKVLKANKDKVDNAIDSAINKLPVSKSIKDNWKEAITVTALINTADHYVAFGSNVEGWIHQFLVDRGMWNWAAWTVSKTLSLLIPIL